ncbi:hypothetical protein YC2023_082907 [Brassica napus]
MRCLNNIGISAINEMTLLQFWSVFGCFSKMANCIDATMPAKTVFSNKVKKLQADELKPAEQITLEPYERDHACVVGGYHVPKKQKTAAAS